MRNFHLKHAFIEGLLLIVTIGLNAQINFTYQSQYKYLKGNAAASLATDWMSTGFSDSAWTTGNAPFHYGDGIGGTELNDMENNYTTLYLRSSFTASNISKIQDVSFTVDYDDGFAIWINGHEVLSNYAPASLAYNALATTCHESGTGEVFTMDESSLYLVEGTNTIVVQGFNCNLASSDFYFDLNINAETNTPELADTIGVSYDVASGFYNTPFNVTLTSPDSTANVIYTLDGSNPQTSATSYTGTSTAIVYIDPSSTTGRGKTPAVVVRASIVKDGYKPSKPDSHTFIFIDKVKTQSYPGGSWPNSNINSQIIYYKVDSGVVNDSRYKGQIDNALLAIPTISIITDNQNLFDPATGIYVNAGGHGIDWEKECSVELIYPDGSKGFNIEAGLRIRGGWSRHPEFPKHAFRLFFRSEYGKAKLEYPLFGNEGVSEFDAVDLRCEENYAWSNGDSRNTCVRDIFSHDTQRDMGQPYTRCRYYHLYINGMYWGLYDTEERAEASYASEYLGGKKDDYDVVKVSTDNWSYTIEATDGNLNSWQDLWNRCATGFASDSNYYKLEGKDANGKPVTGSEIKIDIDNLIDYMLVIFYTGNFDSPTSAFGYNKGCNNFNAIDNRVDKSAGFTFYTHDAEHTLFSDAASPGIGLYEDRVNLATRTDAYKMTVASFTVFHPQWLHYKLTSNAEYRMRFADRAYKYLNGDGALTPAKALARLNNRVSQIQTAIIAESARWGNTNTWNGVAYTKDDNWLPEVKKIQNNFIPYRTKIVIDQLKTGKLYPGIDPPIVKKSGIALQTDTFSFSSNFSIDISNPNATGDIYYTLDGSDPRLAGDGISFSAIKLSTTATLPISSTTILKARVLSNDIWSSLNHIDFLSESEDYSQLKVTELMYHPMDMINGNDTADGTDLEFIEFKNIGGSAMNLSGLKLDSAVHYTFQGYSVLAPKGFFVVASKPSKFYDRYGLVASGNYQGHFSNSGEYVLLTDSTGNPLISFTYDDHSPWPEQADGKGYSMVSYIDNPTDNPNEPAYWRHSKFINGSPFRDDDIINAIENPEVLSQGNILIYPNPTAEHVIIHADGIGTFGSMDIKIFTTSGMLVYRSKGRNNTELNLKSVGLDAGLYILHVETNEYTQTAKIMYSPK